MKIWLVQRSESTPHDGIGEERSMRMGMLAKTLAQRGHDVTWWTSTFDHFRHQHRYETNTRLNVYDNYNIYYIRGFGYRKNISFSRIWDNILLAKRFAAIIRQESEKPNIIVASLPTAELALEAVRYANQTSIPIVLDIRDLWPDVVYDFFPNYTHHLFRLAFLPMTWNLKDACSGASAIIGLTDPFVDWGIVHAERTRSIKDRVFPMGYWSNKLNHSQKNLGSSFWENKGIYKSDDCLLVTFFGTLGKTNDLLPVIRAARLLETIGSNVKFVICGAGQKLSLLQEEAKDLSNIIFPGWINAIQISTLLQIADVGICPYINSLNYINNIPNKPPEYLSSGLVLALSLSHGVLSDLIKENDIGFSYSNTPELLADKLDALSKNSSRLEEMKSNALDTFNKFFDGEVVYNQMATYLEDLSLKQSTTELSQSMDNLTIQNSTEIEYRPSLAGRLAKVVIPFLHKILPSPLYRPTYDFLYSSYNKTLRGLYGIKTLSSNLSGDQEFKLKASLAYSLLPYTMGGSKALENAFEITALAEKRKLQGALVECGVAQGGTSAMMALANQSLGEQTRQKWLFDSYEGLPEPTAEDYEGGKVGEFIRPLPKGSCLGTIEQVSELMFDTLKFPKEEVHLIKGWFQDTVPIYREKVGEIAVLRLDGDWYESTKVPLDNFFDQVVPGGLIIIDDYGTCFGSRKAVNEFRVNRNITTPFHPDGRGGVWFEKA